MGMVKSAVYLILALGFATATVLLAGQAAGGRGAPHPQSVAAIDVVTAGERIGPGESLDGKKLVVTRLPAASAPSDRFARVDDLKGRVAASEILPGDVITDKRLAKAGTPAGIAAMLEPGMRAVAVRIGDLTTVSTMPGVGTFVDVLVTLHKGGLSGQASTRTLLQRVRVLATSPAAGEESKLRPGQPRTVTLMVRPEDAEMLALAGAEGVIHLALRNAADDEDAASAGANMARLLGLPETPAAPPPVTPRVAQRAAPPQPPEPAPVDTHRVTIRRGSTVEEVEFRRPTSNTQEPWSRRNDSEPNTKEAAKQATGTSPPVSPSAPQPNPHAGERRP